ncbi:hypothetical protein PsorP6_001952 [Peronosclerospora sorghi]|uniref:Uncharacterized protein n=1 Tax=Peronosclerospora sorghi TaxID=230839 RepID=A0ACC0WT40_9STRA|nr:hypothetical protein PsorP6_001952 [Peronosclerospora sorghi]
MVGTALPDEAVAPPSLPNVIMMETIEEEARKEREVLDAKHMSETAEPMLGTGEKLAKLDSLLEKASLYSSFLFSNMESAATVSVVSSVKGENGHDEHVQGKRKRDKKASPASSKKVKKGVERLREVQEEVSLDTREKPKKIEFTQPTLLTVMLSDAKWFTNAGFVWKYMVIDEGHRLKNMECKLVRELKRGRSENRLLLTGTPLQNNLTELWSLLNFILPDVFDDLELFESWFSFTPDAATTNETVAVQDVLHGEKKVEVIAMLHEILRPFLLRRLKVDVVEEMVSKTEIFVYCSMTSIQREYYEMIRDGTLAKAMEEKYGKFFARQAFNMRTLRNKMVQLRKCCLHPYLFDEPLSGSGGFRTDENIVASSGKMVILDKMLRELHRKGHKVLLFSQMTRVLDILEDYLRMREYSFCRLDGTTKLSDRIDQMQRFNKVSAGSASTDSDDNIFVFMLSTRAGGLGINLIAADTVIFFDSDWNPQQDNQAMDRCHRIGQTNEIIVYRLVTENSVEDRMTQRALEKRKLERVVIQRGGFKQHTSPTAAAKLTKTELDELLRDDVEIRKGFESGGIPDSELNQILDRQLVVTSFVHSIKSENDARTSLQPNILPFKGSGYEVVENAPPSIDSFA